MLIRLTCLLSLALLSADRPDDPPRYCMRALRSTGPESPDTKLAIARKWAPTIYQETLDPARDYLAAFDFDGDWNGTNNPQNVDKFPLRAVVYYAVVDTDTHWFIQYMPYHPVDYKRIGGHPHDTESLLLVVRKDGGLEAMETRFHQFWYQYRASDAVKSGADDVDGRIHFSEDGHPAVYMQRAGHGLCGGFAPTAFVRDFEIQCDHARAPHIAEAGVVYRYKGRAEVPRPDLLVQEVGYDLVDMKDTIWAHRDDPHAFGRTIAYHGARCGERRWSCPVMGITFRSGADDTAEAPWGQTPGRGSSALGEQFFDPAYTMAKRLRFPAPFSLEYRDNPYLAVSTLASTGSGLHSLR